MSNSPVDRASKELADDEVCELCDGKGQISAGDLEKVGDQACPVCVSLELRESLDRVMQERDDYKADYLRMHKMFMDLKYPDTVTAPETSECRGCKDTGWIVTGTPGERIPCDCDALVSDWSNFSREELITLCKARAKVIALLKARASEKANACTYPDCECSPLDGDKPRELCGKIGGKR